MGSGGITQTRHSKKGKSETTLMKRLPPLHQPKLLIKERNSLKIFLHVWIKLHSVIPTLLALCSSLVKITAQLLTLPKYILLVAQSTVQYQLLTRFETVYLFNQSQADYGQQLNSICVDTAGNEKLFWWRKKFVCA